MQMHNLRHSVRALVNVTLTARGHLVNIICDRLARYRPNIVPINIAQFIDFIDLFRLVM